MRVSELRNRIYICIYKHTYRERERESEREREREREKIDYKVIQDEFEVGAISFVTP